MRVLSFAALVFAVGCGSGGSDDTTTSTGEFTSGDAGSDAQTNACVPCGDRFPAGLEKYEAARRSCYCTEDACRDVCGSSICPLEPKPANAACNECVAANTKCVLSVQTACEADAECTKYVLCKVDAPCQ